MISSVPAAWKTHLKTGLIKDRDNRLLVNLRNLKYPDIARDTRTYIDRGNCESTTAPALRGETSVTASNATFARSTDWSHRGAYSYKLTKAVAAGTEAYVALQDGVLTTDMHGFIAGETIEFLAWAKLPSSGGPLSSEVSLRVQQYYSAGWNATKIDTATIAAGEEEKLYGRLVLNASCAAIRFEIVLASAAADTEYLYIDDIDIFRYASFTLAREDNLIDRGNCESATAPAILGTTPQAPVNATFARSSDFARSGDYSYKFTKTNAAGTAASAYISPASTTNMSGLKSGEAIEIEAYVRVPTASGMAIGEVLLFIEEYDASAASWSTLASVAGAGSLDSFVKLSLSATIPSDDVSGVRLRFVAAPTAALNEYFYVDDIKVTRHSVPGSHYLLGGYTEHLCPLTETGTFRIKFRPTFAYDTASVQNVGSWYVSATQRFRVYYNPAVDKFFVGWIDGGTERDLQSAQYDNGTSYRNINQWIELVVAWDLSTGTTAGSALWLNGTQDDTTWGGNIDAFTTSFNKLQLRAYAGTSGGYDIAYAEYIPNYVATNADVQADFAGVTAERIFFPLDGHATGEARVDLSRFAHAMGFEKGVANRQSGAHSANTFGAALWNTGGEFSDDQYAAYVPASDQFNGLVTEQFLRRRGDVTVESHYNGDWDVLFKGRLSEEAFPRSSEHPNLSMIQISAADHAARMSESVVNRGRVHENVQLVDDCEANSLLHLVAKEARPLVKQYLAVNSFEEATITGGWVQGSNTTLSRQTTNVLFGTAHGRIVAAGGAGETHQSITFDGTEKLCVGQRYTLIVWLLSSAAVSVTGGLELAERDGSGENGDSTADISLSGGEGYVRHSITHEVTDSDSDELRVQINGDDGDTIDIGGAMLISGDRVLSLFCQSSYDLSAAASSGEVSADDADILRYDIFGFNVEPCGYTHPWRRIAQGENVWNLEKSVANGTVPRYIGFNEAGTLFERAILSDDFTEPMTMESLEEDEVMGPITSQLMPIQYNRIIGNAQKIVKSQQTLQMWALSASSGFESGKDGYLSIAIANGGLFPDDADLFAIYGNEISGSVAADATTPPTAQTSSQESLNIIWAIVIGIIETIGSLVDKAVKREQSIARPGTASTPTLAAGTTISDTGIIGVTMDGRRGPALYQGGASLLGIRHGTLIHKSSESGEGLSSLTVDKFDFETHPDGALIRMSNSSGGSITLKELAIRGRPVTALSGDEGYVVDDLADWQSITEQGEKPFILAGADFFDPDQLTAGCGYYWKYTRGSKHSYQFECFGMWHWLQPSAWYELIIGQAGEAEYVDAIVELFNVRMSQTAEDHGQTVVIMREVEERLKLDSNWVAKLKVRGWSARFPAGSHVINIASQYGVGNAHAYCDGVADEEEFQAALDYLSQSLGGGTVHVSPGRYYLSAAIEVPSNCTIEADAGVVFEKNFDGSAITGSSADNVTLRGFEVTRDSSDTTETPLIAFANSDDLTISEVYFNDSYGYGLQLTTCTRVNISACRFYSCGSGSSYASLYASATSRMAITECTFTDDDDVSVRIHNSSSGFGAYCRVVDCTFDNPGGRAIYVSNCDRVTISANTVRSAGSTSIQLSTSSRAAITGNVLMDGASAGIDADAAPLINVAANNISNCGVGIVLQGATTIDATVSGNVSEGGSTGVYLNGTDHCVVTGNRSTNNGVANFDDSGTNTTDSGNDWT